MAIYKEKFPIKVEMPASSIGEIHPDFPGRMVVKDYIWEWLDDNVGPVHCSGTWTCERNVTRDTFIIRFSYESQAILFKLIWG